MKINQISSAYSNIHKVNKVNAANSDVNIRNCQPLNPHQVLGKNLDVNCNQFGKSHLGNRLNLVG